MHRCFLICVLSIVVCWFCAYGHAPALPLKDLHGEQQDLAFEQPRAVAPLVMLLLSAPTPTFGWRPIVPRLMSQTEMPPAYGRIPLHSRRLHGPVVAQAGSDEKVVSTPPTEEQSEPEEKKKKKKKKKTTDAEIQTATETETKIDPLKVFQELSDFVTEFTEFLSESKKWSVEKRLPKQRAIVKNGNDYNQIVELVAGGLPAIRDFLAQVPPNLGLFAVAFFIADSLLPFFSPVVLFLTPGLTKTAQAKLVELELDADGINAKLEKQYPPLEPDKLEKK